MTTRDSSTISSVRLAAAGALLALAFAACTGGGTTGTGGGAATASPVPPLADSPVTSPGVTPTPDITPKPGVSRVPGLPGSQDPGYGQGVPPAVIQAAVDDAAGRAGVEASEVTVVSAESMTWPNGALGCPQPGSMYTQAITPGYRVVVEAGGVRYDYRSTQQGDVRWCQDPPGPG